MIDVLLNEAFRSYIIYAYINRTYISKFFYSRINRQIIKLLQLNLFYQYWVMIRYINFILLCHSNVEKLSKIFYVLKHFF